MWVVSVGFGFLIAALVPNASALVTRFFIPYTAVAAGGLVSSLIGIVAAAIFVSTSRLSERLPAAIPGYELLLTGAIVRALMLVASIAAAAFFPVGSDSFSLFNAVYPWLAMPLGFLANLCLLVGSTKVLLAALPRLPKERA